MVRWIAFLVLLQCPYSQPVVLVARHNEAYRSRVFHGQRAALGNWEQCSKGPGVDHPGDLFYVTGVPAFDCSFFDKDGDCDVDLADYGVYVRQLGALR